MEITRERPPSVLGNPDWFSGEVWVDPIATGAPPSRVRLVSVHFCPGARTAWHTHPVGQVLQITEGVGLVQRRGGPIEVVRAGDTVHFAPGEDHWHGAAAGNFMTHLAMHEVDDAGQHVSWGAHVTDAEYSGAA